MTRARPPAPGELVRARDMPHVHKPGAGLRIESRGIRDESVGITYVKAKQGAKRPVEFLKKPADRLIENRRGLIRWDNRDVDVGKRRQLPPPVPPCGDNGERRQFRHIGGEVRAQRPHDFVGEIGVPNAPSEPAGPLAQGHQMRLACCRNTADS